MFEELGVPCIDADQVARSIHQDSNHPAMVAIRDYFPDAITPKGCLNRGSLRERFSTDHLANNTLKTLMKPYVMAAMEAWTKTATSPYVIWESALIIEENIHGDSVLVITASDNTRIERIRRRNPDWTMEQINHILTIQLSDSDYMARADDVIHNDGTLKDMKRSVETLHHKHLKDWS